MQCSCCLRESDSIMVWLGKQLCPECYEIYPQTFAGRMDALAVAFLPVKAEIEEAMTPTMRWLWRRLTAYYRIREALGHKVRISRSRRQFRKRYKAHRRGCHR